MGDIAHHYIIYNMKSRCDFGAYGEISATGENGFENLKICIFCTLNAENSRNQEKMHFFRTFLSKYFAGIEKSSNFALAFQG